MPNVTMTIDGDLLKKARKYAIDHDTTLTGLVREHLETLISQSEAERLAKVERLIHLMKTSEMEVGPITWTRDDLHDRKALRGH